MDFIDDKIINKKVLICCDKGRSRAPTLGLLYLAKRLGLIPNDSFDSGVVKFKELYPYAPGGIADYVRLCWNWF